VRRQAGARAGARRHARDVPQARRGVEREHVDGAFAADREHARGLLVDEHVVEVADARRLCDDLTAARIELQQACGPAAADQRAAGRGLEAWAAARSRAAMGLSSQT